jgi:hypothetical protein
MSKESTSQIVKKYKSTILCILAKVKITKPKCHELYEEFETLWVEEDFIGLPLCVKEEIWFYSNETRQRLLSEYTILLFDDGNGNKSILNKTELPYKQAFYWFDVKETRNDDGIVTITKTPTDKVYLE